MKKVILALIMGLVVAGGMKEAGAAACCSGSTMGADLTEDSKGAVSSGRDCLMFSETMQNPSEMAGHEGTMGPCDPVVPGNREAKGGPSESHQHGPANEAASPKVQENSR